MLKKAQESKEGTVEERKGKIFTLQFYLELAVCSSNIMPPAIQRRIMLGS